MPDLSEFWSTKETTPKPLNRNAQYHFSDRLRSSDLTLSLNGEQFISADGLRNNVVFTK